MSGRSPVDLDAYLARIGYAGPLSPTLETLRALVTAHIATIPFEALDVLAGKVVDLDPQAVDAKLIHARRGGYCYEQNGLLRRVLLALGFQVEGRLARVRWQMPPGAPPTPRSHMMLQVMIDGLPWLADVGFGSLVPDAPLRMADETPQQTRHDRFRLVPSDGNLRLEADVEGAWLPVYEIDPAPQLDIDYEVANWFTATNPASHFRHRLIVTRTSGEGRFVLAGNRLTIRQPGRPPERRCLDADELERTLAETFALSFDLAWRPLLERAAAET